MKKYLNTAIFVSPPQNFFFPAIHAKPIFQSNTCFAPRLPNLTYDKKNKHQKDPPASQKGLLFRVRENLIP